MNLIYADRDPAFQPWKPALFAIAISAILHSLIWSAWLARREETRPEITSPQVIEVALVAAQPEPVAEPPKPQVQTPPAPAPVTSKPEKRPERPAQKKPAKPKPKLPQQPAPEPEAPAERVQEASPAPVTGPTSASPPAPRPAPAPYVEASYKSPSLHNPPTRYPRLALERQWEGTVTLRVRVLANGSPGEIKVERSSGHELLDDSTVEQVQNWRFIPARKGDQPVDSWVIVPIEYKLKH